MGIERGNGRGLSGKWEGLGRKWEGPKWQEGSQQEIGEEEREGEGQHLLYK